MLGHRSSRAYQTFSASRCRDPGSPPPTNPVQNATHAAADRASSGNLWRATGKRLVVCGGEEGL
ncbi:hypothetical protein BU16DRAFT_332676 [Lophium mytilinum]|uniref:Uncharacterized protein n=1 Tax=Lophium mytilinum TaxID=390894 RepID=A0A6A6R1D3_9PEZI|nr:hypothetical protein BU16DRAFT_332676 [Lophium mytilinum]